MMRRFNKKNMGQGKFQRTGNDYRNSRLITQVSNKFKMFFYLDWHFR